MVFGVAGLLVNTEGFAVALFSLPLDVAVAFGFRPALEGHFNSAKAYGLLIGEAKGLKPGE